MKYLDEYRDGDIAAKLVERIRRVQTKPWVIMEVCGGQTHSIVKNGIDHLLPKGIELVHGPGCPVCVTPLEMIDKAHAIARRSDVIFCSFGDMLRVPGSDGDLFSIKSQGGDVRVVYSPLDCLKIARANPEKQIVFFAIGFETTAPANAMLAWQARESGMKNVALLVSHVLVPPAMEAILSSPQNRVQGFLGPGHVCAVVGYSEYEPLAARFHVPIVVTGFEPLDILEGVLMVIDQLEHGRADVENQYSRILDRGGNRPAQELIARVFEVNNRKWRGVGMIPQSGFQLREEFREFDAECRFSVQAIDTMEPEICISGLILQGIRKPHDCPAFGTECTPQHPLGATMVSAEGACAAYYAYGRHLKEADLVAIGGDRR
jgi:hydrogenase expression/formation protein HypD